MDRLFAEWQPLPVAALAVIATALLGWVDYATGYEFSFSVFYLAPIAFASWYGGGAPGALLCAASAGVWLAADIAAGQVYSASWIPWWNGFVRLLFFAATSALLTSLRRHLRIERELARTDALTGLLNGRAFREICAAHLELARRQRQPTTLGYLDLDDFKRVNDTRGHSEGDRLLRRVAETLRQRLRQTDVVGRLAGDEFAMLLPDTAAAGAESLLRELRVRLVELFETEQWPAGATIGAVVFAVPPATVDAALHRADELMYAGKRCGKNTLRIESDGDARRAG
jgi:diguanylate cyclase (GGDEF)-like protein